MPKCLRTFSYSTSTLNWHVIKIIHWWQIKQRNTICWFFFFFNGDVGIAWDSASMSRNKRKGNILWLTDQKLTVRIKYSERPRMYLEVSITDIRISPFLGTDCAEKTVTSTNLCHRRKYFCKKKLLLIMANFYKRVIGFREVNMNLIWSLVGNI